MLSCPAKSLCTTTHCPAYAPAPPNCSPANCCLARPRLQRSWAAAAPGYGGTTAVSTA
nr:MAG TPA: hypothetical protein [Caudoviricetes sp.]